MRISIAVSVLACLLGAILDVEAAPLADPDEWRPADSDIALVEQEVLRLQASAEYGPISDYQRYYSGTIESGHRVVIGILLSPDAHASYGVLSAGADGAHHSDQNHIHVVDERDLPAIAHGGCMVVNITYDTELKRLMNSRCNIDFRPPPPEPAPVDTGGSPH